MESYIMKNKSLNFMKNGVTLEESKAVGGS
jgi:hypothetical protein